MRQMDGRLPVGVNASNQPRDPRGAHTAGVRDQVSRWARDRVPEFTEQLITPPTCDAPKFVVPE